MRTIRNDIMDYILEHGEITTDELEDVFEYDSSHSIRTIMDRVNNEFKKEGIQLTKIISRGGKPAKWKLIGKGKNKEFVPQGKKYLPVDYGKLKDELAKHGISLSEAARSLGCVPSYFDTTIRRTGGLLENKLFFLQGKYQIEYDKIKTGAANEDEYKQIEFKQPDAKEEPSKSDDKNEVAELMKQLIEVQRRTQKYIYELGKLTASMNSKINELIDIWKK